MNRILSLLLISALFSACSTVKVADNKVPFPTATPIASTPIATLGSTPLKENITFKCSNCTPLEAQRILNAQHMMNAEVKTQCFHDSFTDPNSPDLVQTNGFTPEQVVSTIRFFVSQDIPIEMYYEKTNVSGFTYENDPVLHFNRWFRTDQDYDDGEWSDVYEASNIMHESTHKAGFDHDFNRTYRRPNSVPYRSNKAIEDCASKK